VNCTQAERDQSNIPTFANTRGSDLVHAAEKPTGFQAEIVAFGTKTPFMQDLGMDTIVMGSSLIAQAHQADEYLAFDQIKPTVAVLEKMITQYCL
jgi:acetylornithine deacetylase